MVICLERGANCVCACVCVSVRAVGRRGPRAPFDDDAAVYIIVRVRVSADVTATHCLLLHLNPDWFCLLVPAHLGSPGQRAVKQVCVCVCDALPDARPMINPLV